MTKYFKKTTISVFIIIITIPIIFSFSEDVWAIIRGSIGIVSAVYGRVEVIHKGKTKTQKVYRKDRVYLYDTFKTLKNSKMRILFEDGSILTISENTTMEINEFVYSPVKKKRSFSMRLVLGKIRVLSANLFGFRKNKFLVRTPTATIGTRGTEHIDYVYLDRSGNPVTMVGVLSGAVTIFNPQFPEITRTIKANQFSVVVKGAPPIPPKVLDPETLRTLEKGVKRLKKTPTIREIGIIPLSRHLRTTAAHLLVPVQIREPGEPPAGTGSLNIRWSVESK